MYIQGDLRALCDTVTAAIGKIEAEADELKPKEIMEDWTEYIKGQAMKYIYSAGRIQINASGKQGKAEPEGTWEQMDIFTFPQYLPEGKE